MAIYDVLSGLQDDREQPRGICAFNGYLEDYVACIETSASHEETHAILASLVEIDESMKIVVDLGLDINKEAIANQIIRYKDAFKLPAGTIRCPYVIYGTCGTSQRAIIVTLGGQEAYVQAKALYYVMSEPDNAFEGTRNEIIAINASVDQIDRVVTIATAFFIDGRKAGILQRDLDSLVFPTYDAMYESAKKVADDQIQEVQALLAKSGNVEKNINQMIATWFLMKKFTYVQYMMDKHCLHAVYEGNVKRQRQMAKTKCDEINFISFSELWKTAKSIT